MEHIKQIQRVEEVKRPLIKGEVFLVPCIIDRTIKTDIVWIEGQPIVKTDRNGNYIIRDVKKDEVVTETWFIYPVINHPHSDKENGQNYIHYHVDYRFVKMKDGKPKKINANHVFAPQTRYNKKAEIEYHELECIREENIFGTKVSQIQKSKLKHNCIYKGKCPHRGADLSQVKPINGVITCPLHGLKFNQITGKIIKNENEINTPKGQSNSTTRYRRKELSHV